MTTYDIYVNGQFILSKPNRKEAEEWVQLNDGGTDVFKIKIKKVVNRSE